MFCQDRVQELPSFCQLSLLEACAGQLDSHLGVLRITTVQILQMRISFLIQAQIEQALSQTPTGVVALGIQLHDPSVTEQSHLRFLDLLPQTALEEECLSILRLALEPVCDAGLGRSETVGTYVALDQCFLNQRWYLFRLLAQQILQVTFHAFQLAHLSTEESPFS